MKDYILKVRYIFYTLLLIETILMSVLKSHLSNNIYTFFQLVLVISFIFLVNKTLDVLEKIENKERLKKKRNHWVTRSPNRF